MEKKPRILVVSFSAIHSDSRVLREISVACEIGDVTTVGYGLAPAGVHEHLQIPDHAPSLPQTLPGVFKLGLRRFASVERDAPGTQAALKLIGARTFDLVIANDARALPLAFAVRGQAPVWADLHEWAPEERTHVLSWRLLVSPFMDYLCRKYLPLCQVTSTVGGAIASLYHERYQIKTPRLVRNAAAFADLKPSDTAEDKIRLVHSGGATFGRNIEAMIQATIEAGDRFSLDLYLVPANDGGAYLKKLHEVAQGNPRITFHDPVKPHEIPGTINQYDVGIFWIPPFNTNARLTLPNKIFDFVQGRLAVAVGPTEEMVRLINDYDLGVVSDDFSVESIVSTLSSLTPAAIREWKNNSHAAAPELCFENEAEVIRDIMTSALSSRGSWH